jgi:hypothetical protein
LENPGEPKPPKPEERHGLQNTQTFQNEAGVARGRRDFSECQERSATRAGEVKNKLVCYGTAHDAPVTTLTKIDTKRRAHGVRVDQRSFHLRGLHQPARPSLKNRLLLSNAKPIAKQNLCIKDGFEFALWPCLPTVCVTRAGAGGETPSDWKNAEA